MYIASGLVFIMSKFCVSVALSFLEPVIGDMIIQIKDFPVSLINRS